MALVPCVDCGKEVSTIAVACPNCGRPADHQQTEFADTANITTEPQVDSRKIVENELFPVQSDIPEFLTDVPEHSEIQHKEIGGWLEFFIFGLLFLRPLWFFLTQNRFTGVPVEFVGVLKTIAYIDMGIGFVVAIFLIRKWRKALRITQLYLTILAIYNAVFPFVAPSIIGQGNYPIRTASKVVLALIYSIPAIIWLTYFFVSERVKATYHSSE